VSGVHWRQPPITVTTPLPGVVEFLRKHPKMRYILDTQRYLPLPLYLDRYKVIAVAE